MEREIHGADIFVVMSPYSSGQDTAGAPSLSMVILALYAVLDKRPWSRALELFLPYFGCDNATIVVRPSSACDLGYLVTFPGDESTQALYQANWYKHDPFKDLPDSVVTIASEIISDEEWQNCAFYKDYLEEASAVDPGRILGVNVTTAAGTMTRLRLHRDLHRPPFGAHEKALLAELVPHLRQAMSLSADVNRTESERQLYEEALNRLHVGTIVLDETGRLFRANSTARAILNRSDGVRLSDGQLHGCYAADSRELRRLLAESQGRPGAIFATSLSRPSGARKLGVIVRSIPQIEESEGKARPAWAVFFRDPDIRASLECDVVRQVFGFTPAETLLSTELVNGRSLDEAAEVIGIRRNTARSHLRSIFVKADVTRQSELLRVLLNGVVGLSGRAELSDNSGQSPATDARYPSSASSS